MTTILRKSEMVAQTLDAVFGVIAWSLNALSEGMTPHRDVHNRKIAGGGESIAGGYKGFLSQIRGDWEFYTQVFNFPPWNGAVSMCWLCKASSTLADLAFTDFSKEAGWRSTRWSHEAYITHLRASDTPIPALLEKVVGLRLECIMIDVLHTVDQGVASHIIANIFWVLVVLRGVLGGNNQCCC